MRERRPNRPGLAERLARCGACALLIALALTAAPWLARPAASEQRGVTYNMHSESQSSDGLTSHNGSSTETHSHTDTTTMTSSDGESSTMTTTQDDRADGSRTITTDYSSQHSDGSTYDRTSQEDWDDNGHQRTQTDVTTDRDGNRTTTTRTTTYDDNGNVVDEKTSTVTDKVAPAGTPAPPPARWTGTITYSFTGEAGGDDVDGIKVSGGYADAAVFMVEMRQHESSYWDVSSGTGVGSMFEDLTSTDPSGGIWHTVLAGGDSTSLPIGACNLQQSLDGRTYSLACGQVQIPGVTYMGYEGDKLEEGPRDVTWGPPPFEVTGIAPSSGGSLSGSRKVKVIVPTAGSMGVEVQADITWSLSPVATSSATQAPSEPAKPDRKVQIDAPPLRMVIDEPGQQITVGFEVQLGQKVTVRLSDNKAGPVMVELRRPDGSLEMVGATAGDTYSLPAQTMDKAGTYSVVLESTAGKTGSLSLEVTSH